MTKRDESWKGSTSLPGGNEVSPEKFIESPKGSGRRRER